MNIQNLSVCLEEVLEQDNEFNDALQIVKQNCLGKIWMIGGGVYKNLIKIFYPNTHLKINDLDFLVEQRESYEDFVLPKNYSISYSRFFGIKLDGKMKIDIIEIEQFMPSAINFVEPTIGNFLLHSPLNIQSIAYDVFEKRVIGDVGINAIKEKKVCVNNYDSVVFCSRIRNMTVRDMIKEQAEALNFEPVYS